MSSLKQDPPELPLRGRVEFLLFELLLLLLLPLSPAWSFPPQVEECKNFAWSQAALKRLRPQGI